MEPLACNWGKAVELPAVDTRFRGAWCQASDSTDKGSGITVAADCIDDR